MKIRVSDDKVLTRLRSREPGKPVANARLGEALIDIQTIVIIGLLYWLLTEEQSNPFLRTWLSDNFPLGLYILSPLAVAVISGTLLVVTDVPHEVAPPLSPEGTTNEHLVELFTMLPK